MCLEWSAGRALGAGATEDEIAEVLLAIAPVAGLGRVVAAAPDVAIALGYDIAAALASSTLLGTCEAAASRSSVTGWWHKGQAPRMAASTICSSRRTWYRVIPAQGLIREWSSAGQAAAPGGASAEPGSWAGWSGGG